MVIGPAMPYFSSSILRIWNQFILSKWRCWKEVSFSEIFAKLCGLSWNMFANFCESLAKLLKTSFDRMVAFSQFDFREKRSRKVRIDLRGSGKIILKSSSVRVLVLEGSDLKWCLEWTKESLTMVTSCAAFFAFDANSSHLFLFAGKSQGLFSFRQST